MGLLKARVQFTKKDGTVLTQDSNVLNVTPPVEGMEGLTLEFNAGYAGVNYMVVISSLEFIVLGEDPNPKVVDPDGAVIVENKVTTDGAGFAWRYLVLTSTGKAGKVKITPSNSKYKTISLQHTTLNYPQPCLKAVVSFGNHFTKIGFALTTHNYDVPDTLPSQVENVVFSIYGAKSKFNSANVVNWDVSNLKNMEGMFASCEAFNQDLSKWCVKQFTSEPKDFSTGSGLTAANKPVWGTCPARLVGKAAFYDAATSGSVVSDGGKAGITAWLRLKVNRIPSNAKMEITTTVSTTGVTYDCQAEYISGSDGVAEKDGMVVVRKDTTVTPYIVNFPIGSTSETELSIRTYTHAAAMLSGGPWTITYVVKIDGLIVGTADMSIKW